MESSAKNARVVTSKEGLKLEWLGLKQLIKIHSEDTGGAYCVSEEEMPAGMTVPLHVHHRHSETFRIFHGEIEFRMGDRTEVAGPGTLVHIPVGVPHATRIVSPAKMMTTVSPGDFEKCFIELSRLTEEEARDPAVFSSLLAKYDTELVAEG